MVGERLADRYELEELVGTGGMSSVYKAHDTLLERNVALKILHEQFTTDEEFVERFKREARAVAQLSHPNIVTVIDRGEDGGKHFIVFEYIDGENVKELVTRSGHLPVRDALELALQIARGLAFAHTQGLIHRDVKPQNVLLNGDGRAKVTDFGIARSLDVDGVTQTGTVLGTSNYIAPEQASGRPVDAHTDVYSLGVVLYELLTGDVPFPGENFVAVALKHVNEPPPNLLDVRKDVPLRVAAAVDRALEKDPAHRFPTMDAFAAELEACIASLDTPDDGGHTLVGVKAVGSARRRKRVSRSSVAAIVLGLLAFAGVIVGLVALRGSVTEKKGPSPSVKPVALRGVGSYDPEGDNQDEHSAEAPNATDRNTATYWATESYSGGTLGKSGVGLVVAARRPAKPNGITIATTTPGFTAAVMVGPSANGPFHTVSKPRVINGTTTIPLDLHAAAQYFVVWITRLPVGAQLVRIDEVAAS